MGPTSAVCAADDPPRADPGTKAEDILQRGGPETTDKPSPLEECAPKAFRTLLKQAIKFLVKRGGPFVEVFTSGGEIPVDDMGEVRDRGYVTIGYWTTTDSSKEFCFALMSSEQTSGKPRYHYKGCFKKSFPRDTLEKNLEEKLEKLFDTVSLPDKPNTPCLREDACAEGPNPCKTPSHLRVVP